MMNRRRPRDVWQQLNRREIVDGSVSPPEAAMPLLTEIAEYTQAQQARAK
jgi:hypothetical protein